MTLPKGKGINIQIVSPAGNIEKLKFAVKYGADAVYFGGKMFNLRGNTGNLEPQEIEEGLEYCRKNGVRSIFLLNSFLHECEISNARKFINTIKHLNFDGLMISDPGMLGIIKEAGMQSDIHLSTQMSTLNHLSIKFWNSVGIKRIILARETTLDEIKSIREHTDAELEIFVHGALCISYSGRCLLSRFLSGRDANQGNCSHPCRWKYSLVEEKRPGSHMEIVEYPHGTEIISSKDLCLIEKIPHYINAGINAFKIEGRMKSIYYTANTTRIYKHAIQNLIPEGSDNKYLPFYLQELDLVSHRLYTDDLFNEFDNMGYTQIPYVKKTLFLGYTIAEGRDENEAFVKTFNPIYKNEEIEAIFPIKGAVIKDSKFQVKEILDEDASVNMAQPGRVCLLRFDKAIDNDAIFRRRLQNKPG